MKRCGAGVLKFGPAIARRLRQQRPRPSDRWHLDEMVVRRREVDVSLASVDHEGEVLDMLVQGRRDSRAALRLMRKLLKKQGFATKLLVADTASSTVNWYPKVARKGLLGKCRLGGKHCEEQWTCSGEC